MRARRQLAQKRDELQQLEGVAAFGNHQGGIAGRIDAQIAVGGFGGVQEDGRRSGAAQRRDDLARHVAGLAETGDHQLARMRQDQLDGAGQLPSRRRAAWATARASMSMARRAASSQPACSCACIQLLQPSSHSRRTQWAICSVLRLK